MGIEQFQGRYILSSSSWAFDALHVNDDGTIQFMNQTIVPLAEGTGNHWAFTYLDRQNNRLKADLTFSGEGDSMRIDGKIQPRPEDGFIDCTGELDPIVSGNMTELEYDIDHATVSFMEPSDFATEIVTNDSDTEQNPSVTLGGSVAETSEWNNSIALHVGVKVTADFSIPLIGDSKVEVSTDLTTTWTFGKSVTRTKSYSSTVSVTAPPHSAIKAVGSVSNGTITVKYKMTGTITYKSGVTESGTFHGVFTGANSYNMQVTYTQVDPDTLEPLPRTGSVN